MKTNSSSAHRGLLAGGNWIIDRVKLIDGYPPPEQLANIVAEMTGTGGGPYNILMDLAQSGAPFPLLGAGLVGQDDHGAQILAHCRRHKVDVRFLNQTSEAVTSYTDVMTERVSGRRTFFHARGANARWTGANLDFKKIKARIFHLGYLLLLDALDVPDAKCGTRAGRLLAAAQAAGLKTSVDVVSEDGTTLVAPALQFVDYCILNEIEAGKTTGFKVRTAEGRLDPVALRHAAGALLQKGVRELVVIHFPEGALARNRRGDDIWQPSRSLRTGVCLAAASLSHPTCTAGVKSLATSLALAKRFGFQPALDK